jgi:hypothetical protein
MTYFHAPQVSGGAAPFQGTTQYSVLEQVVFGRSLTNTSPPPALPEFSMPAVAAGAALVAGGALYAARRRSVQA